MASLILSIASSSVSPWLWQPESVGQWTSYPYSVLLTTTMYFMSKFTIINELLSKNGGGKVA